MTIASALPIVIISYMYGIRHGLFTSFAYALIQIVADLMLGHSSVILALFTPSSDSYGGAVMAIFVLLLDYIVAYTVLGLGGLFRNRLGKPTALCLGAILALVLRYVSHVISGAIFYGAWAEWFFTQEGFYAVGSSIMSAFSGNGLAFVYSVFYNGLYMLPEIVITSIAAIPISRLPQIKKS